MSKVQELAAQKAIGTLKPRDDVAPGTYENIKVLVEVEVAELRVGEDYEQRIVAKARPWTIVAAIKKGIVEAKIVGLDFEKLIKAAEDSITEAQAKDAEAAANAVIASLKAPTFTTCKGKVTAKGLSAKIVTETAGTKVAEVESKEEVTA